MLIKYKFAIYINLPCSQYIANISAKLNSYIILNILRKSYTLKAWTHLKPEHI